MSIRSPIINFRSFVTIASLTVALTFIFKSATADSPADAKRTAIEAVERNAAQIATVGDVLYYFGEPGMQEYESSKYLKTTLEQIGFKVELGGAGLPTNVWATWGSGKPVIAIATEMDALPEGSQTPGSIPRKPLVEGARARTHGRTQFNGRRGCGCGARGQEGDGAVQTARHGGAVHRTGGRAIDEPALSCARRLLQGCRCGGDHPYR